jgi:lysozyme family protein
MITHELYKNFVDHIRRWEGKHGGSSSDTGAIKNGGYAPGTKYHTSSGVTWGTYKNYCKAKGITPNVNEWLEMSPKLFENVLNSQFIKKWPIQELSICNPKLALYIIEVAWMSGNGGAERFFAQYQRNNMGINDDDITPEEICKNFTENCLSGWFNFTDLLEYRKEYFKGIKNYKKYGKGWVNRTNAFAEI